MTATARRRRPPDPEATREALLEAARELFAERGYERATIRDIGRRAGVDIAAIARHFGGKEGLYLAALAGASPQAVAPGADPRDVLATLLARWEERGQGPIARAVGAPAISDEARAQVRAVLDPGLLAPLAATLAERGAPAPRLRAELLLAIAAGVAAARANGTLAELAGAPLEEVVAALAPVAAALCGPA